MSRISYKWRILRSQLDQFILKIVAFTPADGVYEVFGIINKKIVDDNGHLNRLYNSLSEIKIKSPIHKSAYIFHIKNLLHKIKLKTALFIYKSQEE